MKSIIAKIKFMIAKIKNKILKQSSFYKTKFSDCNKFWNCSTFDLDIVNLGSSSGKYAFDYNSFPVKAKNWAMSPQALALDFAILQNYCSYLKDDATVILTLCPFTCLVGFKNSLFSDKYYTILNHASIPEYSNEKKIKIYKLKNTPSQMMSNKDIVKSFLKIPVSILKQKIIQPYCNRKKNPYSKKELEIDALNWICNWKKEFNIKDLYQPFDSVQQNNFDSSALLLRDIVAFCKKNGYHPIIVLPPVTQYLNAYFNEKFQDMYIINYLKKAKVSDIPVLNYLDDERFSDPNLYFNSLFLNLRGRKLFTKQVLKDLNK
jgi:hypothetical protein